MPDFNIPPEELPGRYGRPDMYGDPYSSKKEEKNLGFFLLDQFLGLPTKYKAIAGGVALLIVCCLIGACNLMSKPAPSVDETPAPTVTGTASQGTATQGKADPSKFDPAAYGVTVEVADKLDQTVPYTIVSVYLDTAEDFATAKQAVYDAAMAYGLGDHIDEIIGSFDTIAGTDGMSSNDVPTNGDPWQLVTSTPTDYQPCYCVDLYIAR